MPPRSFDAARADLEACRRLLRGGSRSFFAASLLLPARVRDAASALYAFCRLADDAVDQAQPDPAALAILQDRLDGAYSGRPRDHPADRALAAVVEHYAIPRALPEALLEGFAWDLAGRRYEDLDALCDYAARVAGTVGAMMAMLMGARAPDVVARACDLGVAMQLSNIARDVGEDARAGRLYLPLAWMREAGVDPGAWIRQPVHGPALAGVIERLLAAADERYAAVDLGTQALPRSCRPGIRAAHLLYAAIGDEVRRRGYDAIATRAVVPPARKAWLLARAASSLGLERTPPPPLPRAETRFLVDAVAHAPAARPAAHGRWSGAEERAVWVIDLFDRLERRDRLQVGRRPASLPTQA